MEPAVGAQGIEAQRIAGRWRLGAGGWSLIRRCFASLGLLMALGGQQHFFHPAGRNAGFRSNRRAHRIEVVIRDILSQHRLANPLIRVQRT